MDRLILALAILLVTGLAAYILRKALVLRWLIKRPVTILELTPPAFLDKSALATGQLFSVLHGHGSRSLKDRLLGRKLTFSLEIVSTRASGIRYILRVATSEADSFYQVITSYLPEVKIAEVPDSLADTPHSSTTKLITFRQAKHFAFPLASQVELEQHDPMAYLTGSMTKLSPNEQMVFQIVLTPIHVAEADSIASRLLNNEDLLSQLSRRKASLPSKLARLINKVLFTLSEHLTELIHSSPSSSNAGQRAVHEDMQVARHLKPARTLSSIEQELATSIHSKVRQPLYAATIGVLVAADTVPAAKQRLRTMRAALAAFTVPKYQSLKSSRRAFTKLGRRYRLFAFKHRLPATMKRQTAVLAISELADLYHFPHSLSAKTENVQKSLSKTLPAPVSLKSGNKPDIILGHNLHHGTTTPIGLTTAERERHVYIIGGTGNGKTTMLLYGIVQDIKAGKGAAVIDPHGDLAETILRHIPKERVADVIYMNPDDITYPIGLNLLEIDPGLSGDELLREKDLVTESTISVMRKIFSDDDSGGHRIEYILRNTIQTALTLEKPNLFTIFQLLNDTQYRRKVVRSLQDKDLKNFWKNELGKAGDMQKVKMAAGITAKIGRFLFSASAKRVLEQEKSTIDFDDILNSGKILICNFSKGLLGEDTSTLFGTTVLAKLQMASLRRARLDQVERRPFYLYVDEFQNFATMAFVQMLSEARKYRLFLTMAEQSTSQQDQQRLVDIILANVGTVICFRSGSPTDERLVLPLFKPFVEEGEITNLPSFNFYMRIAAVQAQEPLSGQTLLLGSPGSATLARRVKQSSRSKYAIRYKEPGSSAVKPEPKTQHSSHTMPKLTAIQDT